MRYATLTILIATAISPPSLCAEPTGRSGSAADLVVTETGVVVHGSSFKVRFRDRAPISESTPIQTIHGESTARGATMCAVSLSLSARDAEGLVRRIAEDENFYPDFVVAVARRESQFDVAAASPAGAYGLMQLTTQTAARFAVDRCKPEENVRGGIRYLRHLRNRYRNPFHILAAYNTGENTLAEHKGVPPYPETVRYIADIMNDFYGWPPAASEDAPPPTAGAEQRRRTTAKPGDVATRQSLSPQRPQDWLIQHVE